MAAEHTDAPAGRERPRAPRVGSAHTSMSAASAAASPFAALERLSMAECRPFSGAGTISGAMTILEQASALVQVAATGWTSSGDAMPPLSEISESIHYCALEGVNTLIALAAAYLREAEA